MLSKETIRVIPLCIKRDREYGETLTHKTCLEWLDGLLADRAELQAQIAELEETVQVLGLQLAEERLGRDRLRGMVGYHDVEQFYMEATDAE